MASRRKKPSKLKYFVVFSIAMVIIYTIVCTILTATTTQDYSTLYVPFLGVFGGEVLSCALIKVFQIKNDEGNL